MAARLELYGVVDGHHLEHYDDDVLLDAQRDAPSPTEVQQGAAVTPATAERPLFVGFVSASDADEQLLFDVLSAVAGNTAIDAREHGCGMVPDDDLANTTNRLLRLRASPPSELSFAPGEAAIANGWLGALAMGAQLAAQEGTALTWRMHYDRGGSTDDGPDEFPTGHS